MAIRVILFFMALISAVICVSTGIMFMSLPEENERLGVALFIIGLGQLVQATAWISCRLQEESRAAIKKVATDFFYWWYNKPGTNTQAGFDEWWENVHTKREG